MMINVKVLIDYVKETSVSRRSKEDVILVKEQIRHFRKVIQIWHISSHLRF
jgi:hypothetical protein